MVNNTGDLGSLPCRAQLLRVYKRSRHKGSTKAQSINERTVAIKRKMQAQRTGAVMVPLGCLAAVHADWPRFYLDIPTPDCRNSCNPTESQKCCMRFSGLSTAGTTRTL